MTLSLMRLTDLNHAGGEGEDEDLLALGSGEGSNVLRRCFPKMNTIALILALLSRVGADS